MFRSFIYLDEDKLYSYKRQIDGINHVQPRAITKKKTVGITAGLRSIGVNGAMETNISGEIEKDISFDYDLFELALRELDGEDYFDCVLNTIYDLKTVPPMKLIRICSNFQIPDDFDVVNLIDEFKPLIMEKIGTASTAEQEALESFLGNASADIPIIVDYDDITISGKLNAKYLREEYSSLEEYADQYVYILCKVVGTIQKNEVEIFDPLKDFIRMPRAMRKQISDNNNSIGLNKITVEGPVLKVEIIAIYK